MQESITPGAYDATGYLLRYLVYYSAVCFQSIISSWFDKNRLIIFFCLNDKTQALPMGPYP